MLTLDTGQLARQQRITRVREQQHRTRDELRRDAANKQATVANDGALITTEMSQQWGRPMTSVQLFQKLKKLNPNLIYEPTANNDRLAALYYMKDVVDETGFRRRVKTHICGMERNFMPERSVRVPRLVETAAPEGGLKMVPVLDYEIRGWRTVLARLLHAGLLTIGQVESAFPLSDGNSRNWQMLTT